MTRAHYTLDDLGGRLSWPALFSFISYLPPGSLSDDRELRAWYEGQATADLLANLIDILQAMGGGRHRFERPWQKQKGPRKTVGSGAIPAEQFAEWWEKR